MRKSILVVCFSLVFGIFAVTRADAAELIVNGGFETGTLAGWTVNSVGSAWYPWQVTAVGGGDAFTGGISGSLPLFGTRSAWSGFCCIPTANNPEYIQQDVTLPAAQSASIQWSERIQSNLWEFCGAATCGTNTFRVQILNTSNVQLASLQTVVSAFSPTSTNLNTGWRTYKMKISQFAGQTIRIRFSGNYVSALSGNINGPGRMEIDGVSVQSPADPTSAGVSLSGRVTTASGNGIRNSVLTIQDAAGNVRSAKTGSFGYYQFSDLPIGTYTLIIHSKRYTFVNPTRVVTLADSVDNADFVEAQ